MTKRDRRSQTQLPFAIDASRPENLTKQVGGGLRQAIAAGFFKVGEALPSRGELAVALGVSECVVRAALVDLKADGLVHGRPRRGFVVLARPHERRQKLVLDISTDNFGSYCSRVSTVECQRMIDKAGHRSIGVVLGADSRQTPYLRPLTEALSLKPDLAIVRVASSRRNLVARQLAAAGVQYATVTLGHRTHSPGRYVGNLALDTRKALAAMADACVRRGVRSVLQVDFGADTYVDAEPDLMSCRINVERLAVRRDAVHLHADAVKARRGELLAVAVDLLHRLAERVPPEVDACLRRNGQRRLRRESTCRDGQCAKSNKFLHLKREYIKRDAGCTRGRSNNPIDGDQCPLPRS